MTELKPSPVALPGEPLQEEPQKSKGKLKIFFGYAAGVGKTYAMLEEAWALKKAGADVVIGYVEPHQRPATSALTEGFPQIPPLEVVYRSATFHEFDLDSALKRCPGLILVDELAHTNAPGSRHAKRYQDVEELLRMGIDVYTTVNVQHLEGMHDIIEAITGVAVRERVPDHVFDSADRVELVDIEPADLIARLDEGKIYGQKQARRALENFFMPENLIALREIALRRTADRVNLEVEKNRSFSPHTDYATEEHILMCLSSSPSNAKVVRVAAKLAEAFHGAFTALFVETSDFANTTEADRQRLRENLRLAEQLGARIATVYGDDVPQQVAEYARVSGVSKLVMGRPATRRILGFCPANYVDKLSTYAPHLEIFVIPNEMRKTGRPRRKKRQRWQQGPLLVLADSLRALACLGAATLLGLLFVRLGFGEANIITIYILASLFTAVITQGKIYSLISSILAVLLFNFFFTQPYYSLAAYDPGYPVTFVIMFASALITSTFTKRVKEQALLSAQQAHRTGVLLETSQKLQQAKDRPGILQESVRQIYKLLERTIILYPAENGGLGQAVVQSPSGENTHLYQTSDEYAVAQWVYTNNKHAGASTDTLSGTKALYMSIRSGDTVFAVIGIAMAEREKLDSFEKNLLVAMLAECALALEKQSLLEAKNEMAVRANAEQLRASLLRAISHDLRTPLTGIAGGSSFLLENLPNVEQETLRDVLADISSEAQWLSGLVENLLNMTRIQDGRLSVSKKPELADEVVAAALAKVEKRSGGRRLEAEQAQESLFVPMDAQLILQVIINLVDNAFRHTREGSTVRVAYQAGDGIFSLTVSDDGGGIPKEALDQLFDLFFTSGKATGDKQRGMGLGLNICKSIVEAHGGTIRAENNAAGGASFTFTLPL